MEPEKRENKSGSPGANAKAVGWLVGIVLGVVLFGVIKTIETVLAPAAGAVVVTETVATEATRTFLPTLSILEITRTPGVTVTAAPASTATARPSPRPTATPNPLFVIPLEGATSRVFNSDDGDPEFEKLVRQQAANLAIPAPYQWQLYIVPDDTRYAQVRDHYRDALSAEGYNVTYDYQDEHDIYLFKLAKDEQRVAVQFWARQQDTSPAIMVLYFKAKP